VEALPALGCLRVSELELAAGKQRRRVLRASSGQIASRSPTPGRRIAQLGAGKRVVAGVPAPGNQHPAARQQRRFMILAREGERAVGDLESALSLLQDG
jgi:hypothetical protein